MAQPQTPRQFFEKALKNSEQNAPFTALRFTQDVAGAYNFLQGYVEALAENQEANADPMHVAQTNIKHVVAYCVSGVIRDGLTPSEQYKQVLGVWPSF